MRIGHADQAEQADRLLPRLAPVHAAVQAERLADLVADREDRIEGGHRLLEDHRDVVAPHRAHVAVVQRGQLAPPQADRSALDAAGRFGQQPHDRQGGDRLAAAGLADQSHRLALAHLQVEPVHGAHHVVVQVEADLQILDGQHRAGGVDRRIAQLRLCGSTASRRASPTKFHAMMAMKMKMPGTRIQGKSWKMR